MSTAYNLRSSRRTKSGNCYLRKFLNDELLGTSDPKVRVERLKILESCRHERFIIKESQIIPVEFVCEKSYSKNGVWKIVFIVLFLVSSLLYWRDDFQIYGDILLKESRTFHKTLRKHYADALRLYKKDKKIVFDVGNENIEAMVIAAISAESNQNEPVNKVEVKEMIEHYLTEFTKKEKGIQKLHTNFIEEQCRRETKPKLADNLSVSVHGFYGLASYGPSNISDYALESQGARIVSVFDTKPYGALAMKFLQYDFGVMKNFFIQKYFKSKGPWLILVPWTNPGDCWAFKGSYGRVRIELSEQIIITAVSIDHITKNHTYYGNLKSAPKRFSIIGVDDVRYETPSQIFLGTYEYTISGPPTQIFTLEPKVEIFFKKIDLLFESNHGNRDYTCIYKVRVHGHK